MDGGWNRDGACGPHHGGEPTGSAMCLNAKLSKVDSSKSLKNIFSFSCSGIKLCRYIWFYL